MPTVIRVENLSKYYRLGLIGGKTLHDDLNRWWARVRKQPDPLLKIGQEERRNGNDEYIWALRDVSFEVQQGEIVGIIGRNGAGKSTLLKILSRITAPTSGQVKVKGRIASLLEVGTGFHPELTGRENIYLNGAILGMKKAEIDRKFDEIVAFAEVEKFIDTPVKRYSSGMYVRLAFAVAAHLEPEILLVDEVLAVGDAEFQKKCLGKMENVAQEGRTILFVSHNMAAVGILCNTAILLGDGKIKREGPVDGVVRSYENTVNHVMANSIWNSKSAPGDGKVKLLSVRTVDKNRGSANIFTRSEPILVELQFEILAGGLRLNPHLHLSNSIGELLFISTNLHDQNYGQYRYQNGVYSVVCNIPEKFLNVGKHYMSIYLISDLNYQHIKVEKAAAIEIVEDGADRGDYCGGWQGAVRPVLNWNVESI